LLYLPTDELERLEDGLREGQAALEAVARRPGLVTLVDALNAEVTRRLGAFVVGDLLGPDDRDGAGAAPFDAGVLAPLARGLATAVTGGPAPSLSALVGSSGADRSGLFRPRYLWSDDHRFLLLQVTPVPPEGTHRRFFDAEAAAAAIEGEPVTAVRAVVAETRAAFPGLDVGVTGADALSADEEATTRHDVGLALGLGSVGSVLVLVLFFFRSPARSLCVLLCLGVALAWSFAFVTLAIGHLNILSAVFASILIGVGIDFPIHLLARFEEEEQAGRDRGAAMRLMAVGTGATVLASAAVLIAGSLALTVADLPAIGELGVISAAGLALSIVASYTCFPAMLALVGRWRAGPAAARSGDRPPPAVAAWLARARWPLATGLVLAVVGGGLALANPPAFDSNLLNLQPRDTESVRYERALIDEGGSGTWFVVTDAADLAEARRKVDALTARPLVERVESVLDVLPDEQATRARIIERIRPLVAGLEVRTEAAAPFDLEPFRSGVSRLAFKLGEADEAGARDARRALVDLLAAIDRVGPAAAERRLAEAQRALVADLAEGVDWLAANLETSPVAIESLPPDLRDRFVGRTGRLLLRIYPTENAWQREAMARFLEDVRAVDPDVTGPRVQGFEVTEAMRRDYVRSSLVALGLIVVVAAIAFRSVRDALLSALPLVVGGLWTAGAMAALDIDFNLANLFGVPLVIALAVDTGTTLVGRVREEPHAAASVLGRSAGKSVLLAVLTTITGFAPLLVAEHRGVVSLGVLLCLGSILTAIATFVVLPPVLAAMARRRAAANGAGIGLAVLLALGAPAAAQAQAGPVEAVRQTIETARAIIRDPALTAEARDERVQRLIAERFDTEAMARAALGSSADRLSPAEWREYLPLFTTLFTRSYSRMVLSFLEGVEVRYGEPQPAPGGTGEVLVRTTLLKSQGATLPVDYRVKPDGRTFTDVVIDGLSLVASYRSQFERVIRQGGPSALLERMRSRRDR
ncbi:MAG TPA: MMPL family transporter, partial [Thermodesulfobacteriota bacterium]